MVAQQAYDLFIDCIRGGHVCATATFELLGSVKYSCFLSPLLDVVICLINEQTMPFIAA